MEDVALIDEDGSPGGSRQIAMWNPPLFDPDDDPHVVAARVKAEGARMAVADAAPAVRDEQADPFGDGSAAHNPETGRLTEGDDLDEIIAAARPPADGDGQPRGGPAAHGERSDDDRGPDDERLDGNQTTDDGGRPDDGRVPQDGQAPPDDTGPPLNPDAELLDASELIAGRTRRSALSEAAEMLADLVEAGSRTICFIRSRKGVEVVAQMAKDELEERGRKDLARTVIGYRAGYTSGQRHELEQRLVDGEVRCVVTTTALELGIDIGELDACVVVTFPGTVASLRQMWGRAGRRGTGLAVYIAGEDALDQFFCRHPDQFLDRPVEAAILQHENEPIHLAHLLCAAYEAPLDERDAPTLGPRWRAHAEELVRRGGLRERGGAFRPVGGDGFPAGEVALRSASSQRVVIVDGTTGEEIGHVEQDKAPSTVHEGAVYLHLGQQYEVVELNLESGFAVVEPFAGNWWTEPKREIEVLFERLLDQREVVTASGLVVPLSFGRVTVTDTVLAYQRRKARSGEIIDLRTVDLPSVSFETEAVWYEPGGLIHGGGVPGAALPAEGLTAEAAALTPFPTEHVLGSLHAAEHAQIAVLPLLAMCDRWDVGGLSTNLHPQTSGPAIIVYEGHVGGVGIARQGFLRFEEWADDARRLIAECPCESGCPSCVQSPKCGNLNEPLHKAGALELLERLR